MSVSPRTPLPVHNIVTTPEYTSASAGRVVTTPEYTPLPIHCIAITLEYNMSDLVYHGETLCESGSCKNKAYWKTSIGNLCGVHSKRDSNRIELPTNPNKMANEDQRMRDLCTLAKKHACGWIIMRRLRMMKPTPTEEGFFTILPNAASKSKYDVIIAMPSLSPMRLGPFYHGQPGLLPAANLENFHQFNKVFPSEVNEKGELLQVWRERQKYGYADEIAHRHKLGSSKQEHIEKAGGNCLYSIFVHPDGKKYKYDYISSRVFYCCFYEQLAIQEPDWERLLQLVKVEKRSVIIAGYDARDMRDPLEGDYEQITGTIHGWYEDETHPFGHELVLFTMLMLEQKDYPWRLDAAELPFTIYGM